MQQKIPDPHMIYTHIKPHNKLVLEEKDPCILFTMFLMMVLNLNLNKLLHFFYKMRGKKMLLSSDLSETSADEQSAVWKGKRSIQR